MKKDCLVKMIKKEGALYVMIIPAVVLIFLFNYIPMYGVLMAFQNHIPAKGISGSEWVGLKHFISFFRDPFCGRIFKNTILLGAYSLLWGFPAPILLALLLNELRESKFKRFVQTVSYFTGGNSCQFYGASGMVPYHVYRFRYMVQCWL